MRKRRNANIIILGFLALGSAPALADTVFYLDYLIVGSSPENSTPPSWLTAVFQDVGQGTVRLTLLATNLAPLESVGGKAAGVNGWYFNYDSSSVGGLRWSLPFTTPEPFTWDSQTFTDYQRALYVGVRADAYSPGIADTGRFDIKIGFGESASRTTRLNAGQYSVVEFHARGLTSSSFQVKDTTGQWFSVAHLQAIDGGHGDGAWIGTPEADAYALFGTVAATLGLVIWRRRKRRSG